MYAMAKMPKNGQRTGDSNWTRKVAPWRVAILEKLLILAKMTNLDGRNGNCVHFWTYLIYVNAETHKGLKRVTLICLLCLMLVIIHFRKYHIWNEKKR